MKTRSLSVFILFIFLLKPLLAVDTEVKDGGSSAKINTTEEVKKETEKNDKSKDEQKKEKSKSEKKNIFEVCEGGNKFSIGLKNRTEAFYARSTRLLSGSPLDQVVYPQTTIEVSIYAETEEAVKAQLILRNKSRWGNPNSIAQTTESPVKLVDGEFGTHKHFLGRQIVWVKECWAEILLNKAFELPAKKEHTWKMGLFPFELGRGISLGSAYAVSPGLIGFFNSNIIDQFAPGSLIHGTICEDKLKLYYDFYVAVLDNKSDSFDVVNSKIYAQEIGRRDNPYRGFGKINYLIAGKVDWITESIFGNDKLIIEPYGLYNKDPEQRVEFPSDASSNLGTFGIYVDYTGKCFEWGCDFALNYGAQNVKAWDRNIIEFGEREGRIVEQYSRVFQGKDKKIKALVTDANKVIVNGSAQSPALNGKEIGTSDLYNGNNRFRAGYKNKYKGGFMFVSDATYKFTDKFQISATLGLATGDENPNRNLKDPLDSEMDGDYQGFIGLQEVYSGKRVKSLFIIGSNKLVRPLSFPDVEIAPIERFASDTPGFSNLVYGGLGLTWKPVSSTGKQVNINTNVISYWQEQPTKKFSRTLKRTINELASSYLGTEVSLWFDAKLLKSLKAFIITGVFIPGQHYKDIKGTPLNADQLKILDKVNDTGYKGAIPPILGDHWAYVLNFGLEYNF
ncbi:MAG: hypothetical protein P4L22_02315 [Candidatus Babeliales bacterium]|nr:hypothetical protein [Candidatus Babeliales bacterium]